MNSTGMEKFKKFIEAAKEKNNKEQSKELSAADFKKKFEALKERFGKKQ